MKKLLLLSLIAVLFKTMDNYAESLGSIKETTINPPL